MNILIEDSKGIWWKFTGVEDRLFEVVWAGEEYQVDYDCFLTAEKPLTCGQSGQRVYGVECDPETCGYLSFKTEARNSAHDPGCRCPHCNIKARRAHEIVR